MIYRIIGNIYLSSFEGLADTDLQAHRISHVLSVVPGPLPKAIHSYTRLQLPINDDLTSNILAILPESFDFINNCLYNTTGSASISPRFPHKGAILIHCHEGLSRAPTVVVCYLIKFYKLSMKQAIYAIQRKLEDKININESFLKQIEVFESCKGDLTSDAYRDFLIEFNKGDSKEALNQFHTQNDSDSKQIEEEEPSGVLRCKICREILAKSTQILPHVKPDESSRHATFHKKMGNHIHSSFEASADCSHYFLKDPLKWMKLPKEELEGKFHCVKCQSKLGGYSWKGSRCSCGSWVIPSFHLSTSKVDYIKLAPVDKQKV
ncbi:tyrosine protein phosphatase yvh1 [Yamadazyma tenuis]|uniref:protein-tyrosine-phosphatase n=1 Tax=Candida tenuis (strain ATCC 10573 / BCRC 21748 / CBS 615 / JCM 9827 / NBRC 10315 / NRRL Y-1498 / VKM Y-70) TaxID=590646 RepID=G3BEW5_CANTC|nr:uncharacterized protein CANTEDRAFT_128013 [Yamadazyma tenuis ATCC 10573]EGV60612.1 hypothetical protein CANTEDRAFT_128013 [Yamadazyma tenuis ATCC 10573]WEJ94141.1 tyrosine protein phosphatase yvh1 [Yamadazyma tenuis]